MRSAGVLVEGSPIGETHQRFHHSVFGAGTRGSSFSRTTPRAERGSAGASLAALSAAYQPERGFAALRYAARTKPMRSRVSLRRSREPGSDPLMLDRGERGGVRPSPAAWGGGRTGGSFFPIHRSLLAPRRHGATLRQRGRQKAWIATKRHKDPRKQDSSFGAFSCLFVAMDWRRSRSRPSRFSLRHDGLTAIATTEPTRKIETLTRFAAAEAIARLASSEDRSWRAWRRER